MAKINVELNVPFESFLEAVSHLQLKEKRLLLEILEAELEQLEEQEWELSPEFRAEIQEAREAYAAGDSITLDEYKSKKSG
jgi:hypothetical protein